MIADRSATEDGGSSRIRTHGTISDSSAFKADAIDRSAIDPFECGGDSG